MKTCFHLLAPLVLGYPTVASVLHEYYGWQVGVPAYGVAGLVGWRMMDVGDHWASDVLFGAALGCVVGHTVAAQHNPLA